MDREKDAELAEGDLPTRDNADLAREGEENRRDIEQVPEPGTDPLHEGP
jgi:hypothetical protein